MHCLVLKLSTQNRSQSIIDVAARLIFPNHWFYRVVPPPETPAVAHFGTEWRPHSWDWQTEFLMVVSTLSEAFVLARTPQNLVHFGKLLPPPFLYILVYSLMPCVPSFFDPACQALVMESRIAVTSHLEEWLAFWRQKWTGQPGRSCLVCEALEGLQEGC